MVTKEEAKKRIADIAYATLFEAKQHFATYDIMNAFPTIVAVVSLIISIILLGYPEYECRSLGTGLLIFSVLSLYIEKGAKEKEVYNQTAKSLNKIYKGLKALYLEIDESNIKESLDKLKSIDNELEDICHSNHIPLLTIWLAHYNMFLVSRENSKWFVNELGLSLWKDKIPESLKMIIRIGLVLLIVWGLYAIIIFIKIKYFLGE